MRRLLLVLPLLLIATGAFAAEPLIATIQRSNDAFVAAFNRGDAAALAGMYTPNATVMPAGANIQKGRPAIEAFWGGAIKSGLKNISLTALSAETFGPAVREIGRFSFDQTGTLGQTTHIDGKYLVIWKKLGGRWLIDTDIWNTNK